MGAFERRDEDVAVSLAITPRQTQWPFDGVATVTVVVANDGAAAVNDVRSGVDAWRRSRHPVASSGACGVAAPRRTVRIGTLGAGQHVTLTLTATIAEASVTATRRRCAAPRR